MAPPNATTEEASNYMAGMIDNCKFNIANYKASKERLKAENVERRSRDCLARGTDEATGDDEETQLLPEDQVVLDTHFGTSVGSDGPSNEVKKEACVGAATHDAQYEVTWRSRRDLRATHQVLPVGI
jgi:hypothetical protein